MNESALRIALLKLQGKTELPASQFTSSQKQALDRFARQTGAVQWLAQGRGGVYRVSHPELFATHLQALAPDAGVAADVPLRAQHIASARNSKASAHQHECHYLLLKSAGHPALWRETARGVSLDLAQATRDYGAASLLIHPEDTWETAGELWLLENQAVFDRTDWLPAGTNATLLYYGGQLSKILLAWLASRQRAGRVVLFPDYDGVGLANYARLHARLGDQCSFWLMPDWSGRLARYGNAKLWRDTLRDFLSASPAIPPHLAELTGQMQRSGLALEQEAVWL